MPDSQLLTNTLLFPDILAVGEIKRVKFHLQRGLIARVHGFAWRLRTLNGAATSSWEVSIDVRKEVDAPINADPLDLLWTSEYAHVNLSDVGFTQAIASASYTLPKPYRTTGISVQVASSINLTQDLFMVIYYDVDEMEKGEAVQVLESTRQRGISRVA